MHILEGILPAARLWFVFGYLGGLHPHYCVQWLGSFGAHHCWQTLLRLKTRCRVISKGCFVVYVLYTMVLIDLQVPGSED